MGSLVIAIFVLLSGWHAYRSAKKAGAWSNKVFFGVLLAALAFIGLTTILVYWIPPSFAEVHFGLVLTCWLSLIATAVIVITIYANRWWKAVLLKRGVNDQTLKALILVLLLSSVARSAQTTNSAPRGQTNAASANSSGTSPNPKLQALERACKAGVFTPEECAAKRAALTGSDANNGQGGAAIIPPAPQAEAPKGGVQPDIPNPRPGSIGGNVYNDPAGHFSLTIPQGWTAATKQGCYGPAKSCPANSAGVNMMRGASWAFVAPFSGAVKQPTDVVKIVANENRSEYKNFTMIQNEPSKYNGMDVAFGIFTGTDGKGVDVSLAVVGIATPSGQYYVASSSVPKDGSESERQELHAMLDSLRFAGR